MKKLMLAVVAATVLFSVSAANAAVWDGTGGVAYVPPSVNYIGAGPQSYGGVTWTSTASIQGGSAFGWTGGYGFNYNGYWSGTPMEGVNDSFDDYGVVDTMTFTFTDAVTAFGGEINWVQSSTPVTIAAYDSSNNLLDIITLSDDSINLQTPNQFYGFIEGSASIAKVELTDGYIGIQDIKAIGLPIPEPATWIMMILGFGMLGFAMRARRDGIAAVV